MSSKNQARKNAARKHRATHGGGHQTAVNAVRQDREPDLIVVEFPAPDLDGAAQCTACIGSGLGPNLFEQPADGNKVLLVQTACPNCMGCGRAEHEGCQPGAHADDDPDEIADHLAELDEEAEDDEPGERCPSCHGFGFHWDQAVISDPAHQQALAELFERARAQGMSEWDVQGAAAFGELDDRLGEGSTAILAEGIVYLRLACGCQADRARIVDRSELHQMPEEPLMSEQIPPQIGALMTVAFQIPELVMELDEVLAEHGGDVALAAADRELLSSWTEAEPESRAALLVNLAWHGRTEQLPTGDDDHASMYVEDLHTYARDFPGDSEAFHGTGFPALPLPGQAGALASSLAFDRDDLPISLKTAVVLFDLMKKASKDTTQPTVGDSR